VEGGRHDSRSRCDDQDVALYFLDLEGTLLAVKVELGTAVVADVPQRLFSTRSGETWSSASDGERFVLGVPEDPNEDHPISLILDWKGAR